MVGRRIISFLAVLWLAAGASACGGPEPYVYVEYEFNRELPTFRQEQKNLKVVEVCYSKFSTTPRRVAELAEAECAKFDKAARFDSQDFMECPLLTPARARFHCVKE